MREFMGEWLQGQVDRPRASEDRLTEQEDRLRVSEGRRRVQEIRLRAWAILSDLFL